MAELSECDVFRQGSYKWRVCRGEVDHLPVTKINAYRETWGLPPLAGSSSRLETPVLSSQEQTQAQGLQPKPSVKFHGHSVDNDLEADRVSYGPGTELLKKYSQAGVPTCDACRETAQKMNKWGCDGCEKNLEELVEEIFPRAKEWLKENHPWAHRLLPNITQDTGIRLRIRQDLKGVISTARENLRKNDGRSQPRSFKARSTIKRKGRSCCGGKKKRQATRRPVVLHGKKNHVSNLMLSTAFGPPREEGFHTMKEVKHRPFDGPVTRNLLYHIYPHGRHWKWNLDQLLERIDLFNGRKIVAIAVDGKTASASEVRKYIGKNVHEYLVYGNNSKDGEMVSFVPQLEQLQTLDPNQITFRAHGKGVTQKTKRSPHIIEWAEMLYTTNLDRPDLVEEHLSRKAMTGSCRKFGQFIKRHQKPTYSGTFYWFRNVYVYSRKWDAVVNRRWGCEEWPARMFNPEETECLFLDNTNSMYDINYWKNVVKPSYEKWKREHKVLT